MAGCLPCFIIPLLLFIFHRYIQPIILKFWNPWEKVEGNETTSKAGFQCLSCNKDKKCEAETVEETETNSDEAKLISNSEQTKLKTN